MKKSLLLIIQIVAISCFMASCSSSKKITYMQNIQPGVSVMVQEIKPIRFEPGDKMKIVVHSRDADVAKAFNILDNSGQGRGAHSIYTVDQSGYVDIPVLGPLKVAGLTREETVNEIKYRLVQSKMIKDPVVTIDFQGLGFSVLGEVHNPGRKQITRDHITLLEGISEAGDLTIDGLRDNVLVLRTENGKQVPYRVNLLDAQDLYASPVYYLQQNDVIYVEPNEKKKNTSTANGNSFLTPGFWMSTASFLVSIILLIFR